MADALLFIKNNMNNYYYLASAHKNNYGFI